MIKERVGFFADKFIILLLAIFFITEHHTAFTAIKNISLYLALLLTLVLIWLDRSKAVSNFQKNFASAKLPILALGLFIIYNLLLSCFPYEAEFSSFQDAFKEFARGFVFLFIILFWFDCDPKKVSYIFYSILAAFIIVTLYFSPGLFTNISNLSPDNPEFGRLINRRYADYVDRFLGFGLVAFVLARSNLTRIFIAVFCLLLPCVMDVFSGARGSWLAAFVGSFIFLTLSCLYGYKEFYKKHSKFILIFTLLGALLLGFIFSTSSLAQWKITQGNSSGRDLILKERLPLLMGSHRAFWGLGYGKDQYDEFLRDQVDAGAKLSMTQIDENSQKYWWNDEPFFIGHYYYHGAIGTLLLGFVFLWVIYSSFKGYKRTLDLFYLGIFISVISYFGVRGLFEAINLRILYMFYLLGFMIMLNSLHKKAHKCV